MCFCYANEATARKPRRVRMVARGTNPVFRGLELSSKENPFPFLAFPYSRGCLNSLVMAPSSILKVNLPTIASTGTSVTNTPASLSNLHRPWWSHGSAQKMQDNLPSQSLHFNHFGHTSLLPCIGTDPQVLGIRAWASLEGHYSGYRNMVMSSKDISIKCFN